jgi:hypothetical protein
MLKIPSLWQFPMGELKDIIEHYLPLHRSSTILGIIMQYKCIHLNPRGWPVLVLIFKDMHVESLHLEAICCLELGNYKKTLTLANRARELLNLCGMSQGFLDCAVISLQAEVHRVKSEYIEVHNINSQILQATLLEQELFWPWLYFGD